jgi:hypothetical protein
MSLETDYGKESDRDFIQQIRIVFVVGTEREAFRKKN